MFTSAALLHPVQGQDPLFRFYSAEVILLTMQIGCDITAHESKECGNRKRFIAIANDAVVDCVFVEKHAEPGDEGVDRNHQQDANDTGRYEEYQLDWGFLNSRNRRQGLLSLFRRPTVMRRMTYNQVERHHPGHNSKDSPDDESDTVKSESASPQIDLVDCYFQRKSVS